LVWGVPVHAPQVVQTAMSHDPLVAPPAHRSRRGQWLVSERRRLLMVGDTLAILLAALLSLLIWMVVDGQKVGLRFVVARSYWFPILAFLWLVLASADDFYSLRIAARIDTTLMRLVQVTAHLWVLYLIAFFFSPRDALPRLFILYYGVLSFVAIAAWRAVRPLAFGWTGARRRALIVGAGHATVTLIEALHEEVPGNYELVGLIVEPDDAPSGDDLPAPVLGTGADLPVLARQENVSEVILAQGRELSGRMFQAVVDCYAQGIRVVPMPLLYEQITGRVPVEHVGQRYWTSVLPIERGSRFDPYPLLKRGIDLVLSFAGLLVFGVLLPVIAPILWLDSPGPIFYRQERVGQGGSTFWLVKLRSMVPDAERGTGPQWTRDGDPRITRVGRVLRRTRLDEVPQLLNVLRGEMSLIGPRPERPAFVEELSKTIPFYRARHVVKPGITGWAQVRHPYGKSAEDALVKLQYDLYYIRHRSLALDLLIALRTVGNVFSLRGM
jgi:exopolysaccharide biosynthesis polyprenyl glycosylphosphotransferase